MKTLGKFKALAGVLLAPAMVAGCIGLCAVNYNEATQTTAQDQNAQIAEPIAQTYNESPQTTAQDQNAQIAEPIAQTEAVATPTETTPTPETIAPETEAEATPFSFDNVIADITSTIANIPFINDLLKVTNPSIENNNEKFSNLNNNQENNLCASIDGYEKLEEGLWTDDSKFKFNTYKTPEGKEVAFISGCLSGMLSNTELTENHILRIPIYVTGHSPENAVEESKTYEVHAIEQLGLQGSTTIGDYTLKKYVEHIIIEGWDADHKTGGWFKHLQSNSLAYYNYTSTSSTHLESITLPDCMEGWSTGAFNEDRTLKYISVKKSTGSEQIGLPSSLTYITENCFADCHELSFDNGSIVLPPNITYIGYAAFYYCTSLTNVDFSQATNLNEIQYQAFQSCSGLTSLSLPDSVTSIQHEAFVDCYNIKTIKLSNSITTIGPYAFANTTVGAASTTPSKIEYLYIPESTITIDEGAFLNSQNLKEVVIGNEKVNSKIGQYAFANCPSIVSMTFLWNPPWLMYSTTFMADNSCKYTPICGVTPAIDVRFRPLSKDLGDYGIGNIHGEYNYWMLPYWAGNIGEQAKLDAVFPANSTLSITAAFCNEKYGHDLEKYLEEKNWALTDKSGTYDPSLAPDFKAINTGIYDNETLKTYNGIISNIQYRIGISIPDTLEIKDDTGSWKKDNVMKMRTYGQTNTSLESGSTGTGSKTIFFIYNNTQIIQAAAPDGRDIDDGILNIGNNAIQVCGLDQSEQGIYGCNTLNVEYLDFASGATKPNPCIINHSVTGYSSDNNNLKLVSNLLTDNSDYSSEIPEPKLAGSENDDEPSNLLKSSNYDYDMTVNDACCIFAKSFSALNIKDITFGGNITEEEAETKFGNVCELGCVYNSGKMIMENCTFMNSSSTYKGDIIGPRGPISYGGSCVFNFGDATIKNCSMSDSSAAYDGGAVMNVDTLTMENCTINNCTAAHYGGAVFDNVGDTSKGGEGKEGKISVTSCIITNNSAAWGGGIAYRNSRIGTQLTLAGACTFSANTDNKGNSDICIGPNLDSQESSSFSLYDDFSSAGASKITVAVARPKNDLVLCNWGAEEQAIFVPQDKAYEIKTDNNNLVLKLITTTYKLVAENNGSWVDEFGNTVTEFTAIGTSEAHPAPNKTIIYKDAEGKSHTLIATPNEGYECSDCTYADGTYTAIFTEITEVAEATNWKNRILKSIENRNADTNEAIKMEIYAK